jgi:ABC-type dipeptide/oligopeptide/nickel transport system ATPase component
MSNQHASTEFWAAQRARAMTTVTVSPPTNPVLHLRLSVDYPGKACVLREVTLDIDEGEIVGLIGESGSGKSTLALAILRLLEHKGGTSRGEVIFRGRHLEGLTRHEMQQIRGNEIALISQSAMASLNPALRIGTQLAETWKAHQSAGGDEWQRSVLDIFERVRLPADEAFLRLYPHQLSVGQAQRVLIAMAVMHRPRLLIADEPTSALDAITQAEVIDLLKQLNREMNMAVLFISHELLSIASLCRRVAILEKGEVVESGSAEQIFCSPEHPYTRALVGTLRVELPVFSSANGTQKSRTRIFKAHLRTPTHGWRARG